MKKRIVISIIIVILVLFATLGCLILYKNAFNQNYKDRTEHLSSKKIDNNYPTTEVPKQTTITTTVFEENKTEKVTEKTSKIIATTVTSNKSNIHSTIKSTSKTTYKTTTAKKESIKKPWEKLGMTEYQYYNEPMYSYEKVDFSIDKYGSESLATKACIDYGNNYEPYLNGEVAYHCTTVSTASGKILGVWFHTENLIR